MKFGRYAGAVHVFLFLSIAVNCASAIKVDCSHTSAVCTCENPASSDDDTCEFTLVVEHLQTFTRYEVTESGTTRGTAGRVWYIDDQTGEFKPHQLPEGSSICGSDIGETDTTCTEPFAVDGYTFRSFITVNGRMPGPTLIVEKDKYVVVHVLNQLASEATSIHWHGMHQLNTHWMDGVEHVTQCGIAPGTNFTYIFQAKQTGTHWYHSHSGAQRTEGLFGALIVKEDEAMLQNAMDTTGYQFQDLPEQHTLTLLDWQKENSIDLFTQIHSGIRFFDEDKVPVDSTQPMSRTYSVDGAEVGPVPYWSGLINGKGKHQSVNYIQSRLSIFTVDPDSMYRFRLIGAQSLFAYRLSVDEHQMILFAMDGVIINPVTVDYIILHSGERYDFLLQTKSSAELDTIQRNNFIIRAETLEVESEGGVSLTTTNNAEAILHYRITDPDSAPESTEYESIASNSLPVENRCTETEKCLAFNCPFKDYPPSYNINCTHVHRMTTLFPLKAEELPDLVVDDEDKVFLNFGFEGVRQTSAINARNMKLPSAPLGLLTSKQREDIKEKEFCKSLEDSSVCNRSNAAISPKCTCTHVKEITKDHSIQMVFTALGPNPTDITNFLFAHPVHLHGHYFHVLDIQFGTYDSNARLVGGNTDIDCGDPSKTELCNVPKWKNEMTDFSYEKEGSVDPNSPLKDTVLIPAGGYAVVYFKANNPGYWFLHCHIEVHQLEGMGVVISEAVDEATKAPTDLIRNCGNFSLSLEQFKAARDRTRAGETPGGTASTGGTTGTRGTDAGKAGLVQYSLLVVIGCFVGWAFALTAHQ